MGCRSVQMVERRSGRRLRVEETAATFAESACTSRRRPCVGVALVPETCCFVKSARYLSCECDDVYCDMKLSKSGGWQNITCRQKLTRPHLAYVARQSDFHWDGEMRCTDPSTPAGGFSCTRQRFAGGTNYSHGGGSTGQRTICFVHASRDASQFRLDSHQISCTH